MAVYIIVKNTDRYPGIGKGYPDEFLVEGLTAEQADLLAFQMSNHEAGCQYAFYVRGGDGDD